MGHQSKTERQAYVAGMRRAAKIIDEQRRWLERGSLSSRGQGWLEISRDCDTKALALAQASLAIREEADNPEEIDNPEGAV